jgi:protein-S-isoprenylcysteine O-methyltransferase Ste14
MTLRSRVIRLFYNLATGSRKIRNFFTPLGALFFALLVFLFVIAALQVDRIIGVTGIFTGTVFFVLASILFLMAFVLIGWSVFNFFRAKGTPVPFNPPPLLVTTGPYAYVRNPMLTGVFALLFGIGVSFGSFSLVVIFTPLFIILSVLELKAIEEPELIKRLGQDYVEYRKRTPMFFPSLRKIFKRGMD